MDVKEDTPRTPSATEPETTGPKDFPDQIPGGRYHIVDRLSTGAIGAVYKALDTVLDRPVAVKCVRLDTPLAEQSPDELRERFVREARIAARLQHPNIVTIHDIVATPDRGYIIMEFIEGRTLESLVGSEGRLPLSTAIKILSQLSDALDYAHERNVVHRDVKPSNILVSPSMYVWVTDFGIAKSELSTNLTMAGGVLGAPDYMSPEQAKGDDVDARSDLFSLGCILFEAVSGEKPFRSASLTGVLLSIINDDPVFPLNWRTLGLPIELKEILHHALEKEREKRYASGAEMIAALRAIPADAVAAADVAAGSTAEPTAKVPFVEEPDADEDEHVVEPFTAVTGARAKQPPQAADPRVAEEPLVAEIEPPVAENESNGDVAAEDEREETAARATGSIADTAAEGTDEPADVEPESESTDEVDREEWKADESVDEAKTEPTPPRADEAGIDTESAPAASVDSVGTDASSEPIAGDDGSGDDSVDAEAAFDAADEVASESQAEDSESPEAEDAEYDEATAPETIETASSGDEDAVDDVAEDATSGQAAEPETNEAVTDPEADDVDARAAEAAPKDGIDIDEDLVNEAIDAVAEDEAPVIGESQIQALKDESQVLHLSPTLSGDLRGVEISPEEGFLLSRIDGASRPNDIISVSPMAEAETVRALLDLLGKGLIRLGGVTHEPVAPAPEPTPLPAPNIKPARGPDAEVIAEVDRLIALAESEDYPALLGLAVDATESQRKRAYLKLVAKYHPDKFPTAEKSFRDKISSLCASASEAVSEFENCAAVTKDAEGAEARSSSATSTNGGRPHSNGNAASLFDKRKHARELYDRALVAYERADYWDAIQLGRQAIEVDETVAEFYGLLGRALLQNKKWRKEAADNFLKASQLEPANLDFIGMLGAIYQSEGLTTRASSLLEKARALDPDYELPELDPPSAAAD